MKRDDSTFAEIQEAGSNKKLTTKHAACKKRAQEREPTDAYPRRNLKKLEKKIQKKKYTKKHKKIITVLQNYLLITATSTTTTTTTPGDIYQFFKSNKQKKNTKKYVQLLSRYLSLVL